VGFWRAVRPLYRNRAGGVKSGLGASALARDQPSRRRRWGRWRPAA